MNKRLERRDVARATTEVLSMPPRDESHKQPAQQPNGVTGPWPLAYQRRLQLPRQLHVQVKCCTDLILAMRDSQWSLSVLRHSRGQMRAAACAAANAVHTTCMRGRWWYRPHAISKLPQEIAQI